jgi:purine catabolism regulator
VALTVAATLELEIFRRVGAEVRAGGAHLDRIVRWVHAAEIPDIARFLTGGEVLLTAGLGIGGTAVKQREYVRSVANAGIAVLVIELSGRAFSEMPPALLAEAEVLGLPVVAIPETPFVEVAAQVHGAIVDLRVAELLEDEAINEAFTELLLNGADYLSIVSELSDRARHPVVLENSAHVVVAYAGRSDVADAALSDWDAHSRLSHPIDEEASHLPSPLCTRKPVVLRGEHWGWVHVLHGSVDLPPQAAYAAGRAAASIAITLLGERLSGARRSQRHGALISRLMLGDVTGEEFIEGALKLGRDMRQHDLIVVVVGDDAGGSQFGEAELASCLTSTRMPWVAADTGDSALAVVGLPPGTGDTLLVETLKRSGARAGLSRVVAPRNLRTAVQQARDAFAATGQADGPDRLTRFDSLGVMRLLIALAQGPELANYVEDELGPLLAHDAGSSNPLLETLRAILESDGRKSDAAKLLYVQRRTLYYRMARIDTVLGVSLDLPDTRQRLLLALRGLELLERRGQRGPRTARNNDRNAVDTT